MPDRKIRRALVAVYDKTGIAEFARTLVDEFGIEIISTGGTAKHLKESGIPVTLVEQITGFPEMLDGRVKTLHPKIHAAILADRDNPEHMRQLAEHGIEPIDMVVVNLYPFEKTVAEPGCTFEQAIEMIDIGGPCLLRAAAKNHRHVVALADPLEYEGAINGLREDPTAPASRLSWHPLVLPKCVFEETSRYDARIASWLARRDPESLVDMEAMFFSGLRPTLRYGENPHQTAEVRLYYGLEDMFVLVGIDDGSKDNCSYNNFVDADAALGLCAELTRAGANLMWDRSPDRSVSPPSNKAPAPSSSASPDQSSRTAGNRPISGEHITRRHLPHIQQPGATYFITFRTLSGELSPTERDLVLSACRHWHGVKLTLHAAVVMPDHVHLLLSPHEIAENQWVSLGELLKSIKGYSGHEISKRRGDRSAVWQDESFDRVIRNEKEFMEKWEYMEANPVTAGLVTEPAGYKWFWHSPTELGELVDGGKDWSGDQSHKGGADRSGDRSHSSSEPQRSDGDRDGPAQRVVVFIKHTNACGAAVEADPIEAYRKAYLGDPNAAMGGILAVNFAVEPAFAETVMETYQRWGKAAGAGGFFVEVWIAPSFEEQAVEIIRTKKEWGKRVRLLQVGDMGGPPDAEAMVYRTIAGGMLVQTPDLVGLDEDQWKVVTKRAPTDAEMADLRLAWLVCKHTKSNAITVCKNGTLIGNGAGQMSRVMSCRIATWLAKENGHADMLKGAVAASDAFFPFRDGPDILMDAGVTAFIQPGGSKRDQDTVAACNERGVAMIFTRTRHFRH